MAPKKINFGDVFGYFLVTFSIFRALIDFGVHFGRLLASFWLPFGRLCPPLAPFWSPFGSLWLTFGRLLARFGVLLASFWSPLVSFWHPLRSLVDPFGPIGYLLPFLAPIFSLLTLRGFIFTLWQKPCRSRNCLHFWQKPCRPRDCLHFWRNLAIKLSKKNNPKSLLTIESKRICCVESDFLFRLSHNLQNQMFLYGFWHIQNIFSRFSKIS